MAFLVSLFLPAASQAQSFLPQWPVKLQRTVSKQYRTFDGELALYVEDIKTGIKYTHNAETPMYIASGVKIPFMIELLRQADAGKLSLDEQMVYGIDDVRDGSPVFNYVRPGTPVSLRIVLEAMIQQSDNAASDMVAKRVGLKRINDGLRELGYEKFGPITSLLDVRRLVYRNIDERVNDLSPVEIRAVRLVKGREARILKLTELLGELPGTFTIPEIDRAYRKYYSQGYNSTSMAEFGRLLRDIALLQVVNAKVSQQMIDIMLGTMTGQKRVTAYLPPGTPVAHKTGTQSRRICDLAIIYVSKHRPVVFAACAKTGRSRARAEEVIARAARRTFELLAPASARARLPELTASTSTSAVPKKKKRRRKKKKKPRVSDDALVPTDL